MILMYFDDLNLKFECKILSQGMGSLLFGLYQTTRSRECHPQPCDMCCDDRSLQLAACRLPRRAVTSPSQQLKSLGKLSLDPKYE